MLSRALTPNSALVMSLKVSPGLARVTNRTIDRTRGDPSPHRAVPRHVARDVRSDVLTLRYSRLRYDKIQHDGKHENIKRYRSIETGHAPYYTHAPACARPTMAGGVVTRVAVSLSRRLRGRAACAPVPVRTVEPCRRGFRADVAAPLCGSTVWRAYIQPCLSGSDVRRQRICAITKLAGRVRRRGTLHHLGR